MVAVIVIISVIIVIQVETQESSPTNHSITHADPIPQRTCSWAAACSLLTKVRSARVRNGAWDHPGSGGF